MYVGEFADIYCMILIDKTKQELNIDTDTCAALTKVYCQCDYCGSVTLRSKHDIVRGRHTVAKDACSNADCMRQKRQESQLVKYGTKNYVESEEFKQKAKQTCLERYGVENYSKTDECQKRRRKTSLERYGHEEYLATEDSKRKRKETCVERYGVDHYSKTQERAKKVKQTNLERFGVDHYAKTDDFKKKVKTTCQQRYGEEHASRTGWFKEKHKKTMMDRYGVPCGHLLNRGAAVTQSRIREFLNEHGGKFEADFKLLDSNKEIDLYDPDRKLAVEYCGLYWHTECSPNPKTRSYHYDKYLACNKKGVRLFTIFEDEWLHETNKCKNVILANMGVFERRLYARSCVVEPIDTRSANNFLDSYHLLGRNTRTTSSFGIWANGELLGVMCFGRHHRNHTNDAVLNRLCFKGGVQVVGGANKLLAAAETSLRGQHERIVSWSDNRWSSGGVYRKMGFTLDAELPPDYSYVDVRKHIRVTKQSRKKKATSCPQDKTEREWALLNGLARIWDCGKKRWVKLL